MSDIGELSAEHVTAGSQKRSIMALRGFGPFPVYADVMVGYARQLSLMTGVKNLTVQAANLAVVGERMSCDFLIDFDE